MIKDEINNRWMSIRDKVDRVAVMFDDSDLPTFLEIDGKRVPFVIEKVLDENRGETGYSIIIKIKTEKGE